MFLLIEIVIIAVLISALSALLVEEVGMRRSGIPHVIVKECWEGEERRMSVRMITGLPVRYSIEIKPHIKRDSRMKDLSRKGMCLLISEKLREGTLLFLEFDIPGIRETISVDGKVVWADGDFDERGEVGQRLFRTGVQFVNIKPGDSDILTSYINKTADRQ